MDVPTIVGHLRSALLTARRAQDRVETDVLRAVLAAIDNAGAVTGSESPPDDGSARGRVGVGVQERDRRTLTTEDVVSIVRSEATEAEEAAASWRLAGNHERAAQLDEWARRIREHLRALGG